MTTDTNRHSFTSTLPLHPYLLMMARSTSTRSHYANLRILTQPTSQREREPPCPLPSPNSPRLLADKSVCPLSPSARFVNAYTSTQNNVYSCKTVSPKSPKTVVKSCDIPHPASPRTNTAPTTPSSVGPSPLASPLTSIQEE